MGKEEVDEERGARWARKQSGPAVLPRVFCTGQQRLGSRLGRPQLVSMC